DLMSEFKKYEDEVNRKMTQIEGKQEEYVNLLKEILNTTKDQTTKNLVKKFLIDDEETYKMNKEQYEKEQEEQRRQELLELENKEREKIKIKLMAEEKELGNEKEEQAMIDQLEREIREQEDEIRRKLEHEYMRKAEKRFHEMQNERYDNLLKIEQRNLDEVNKELARRREGGGGIVEITTPKSGYHYGDKHTSKAPSRVGEEQGEEQSVKTVEIGGNDSEGEYEPPAKNHIWSKIFIFTGYQNKYEKNLLNYIAVAIKPTLIKLIMCGPLSLDKFYSFSDNLDKQSVMNAMTKICQEFMASLTNTIKQMSPMDGVFSYLKFIVTPQNMIPMKFFSFFELTRCQVDQGVIVDIDENQRYMILSFYIFIKIIITYFLRNEGFLPKAKKAKNIDTHSKDNLRAFASLIWFELFYWFKNIPNLNLNKTKENFIIEQQSVLGNEGELDGLERCERIIIAANEEDKDPYSVSYLKDYFYPYETMEHYNSCLKIYNGYSLRKDISDFILALTQIVLSAESLPDLETNE
ncbi:MAG: hypothetical protein MJ252_17935, partial [archaeon]|nr:hypothetical protein [archaeon]